MVLSGGERIHEKRALQNGATVSVHADPRRPWDSGVRTHAWRRIVRPGSVVEGRSNVALESTKTHLHATIDLEILVDGAPHFSRHWTESIKRGLL